MDKVLKSLIPITEGLKQCEVAVKLLDRFGNLQYLLRDTDEIYSR